jgi:hypothetical protein
MVRLATLHSADSRLPLREDGLLLGRGRDFPTFTDRGEKFPVVEIGLFLADAGGAMDPVQFACREARLTVRSKRLRSNSASRKPYTILRGSARPGSSRQF